MAWTSPSFTVSEERGFYHCFGCGEHGDVFSFVMKTQSVPFPDAVRIVAERFRPNDWNIYAAQASDGDNAPNDKERTGDLLQNAILPVCQYFAYLEVGTEDEPSSLGLGSRPSDLWRTYDALRQEGAPFGMRKVRHRRDIFPVFRELFQKRSEARSAP